MIDRISSHSLPARRAVSELTSQEIQSIPDRPPPSFSQTHLAYYSFLFFFFLLFHFFCFFSLMAIKLILTDKSSFVTNIKTLIPAAAREM